MKTAVAQCCFLQTNIMPLGVFWSTSCSSEMEESQAWLSALRKSCWRISKWLPRNPRIRDVSQPDEEGRIRKGRVFFRGTKVVYWKCQVWQNAVCFFFPTRAVQEERQRSRERSENEAEPIGSSSSNEDMPVERILEAEMAVEPKTEPYGDTSADNSVGGSLGWDFRLFTFLSLSVFVSLLKPFAVFFKQEATVLWGCCRRGCARRGCDSAVEHLLGRQKVTGSIPHISSFKKGQTIGDVKDPCLRPWRAASLRWLWWAKYRTSLSGLCVPNNIWKPSLYGNVGVGYWLDWDKLPIPFLDQWSCH